MGVASFCQRRRRRPLLAAAAAAAALGPAGCYLLVDTDGEQCETSADCAAKGRDFAGYACSEAKVCVAPAVTGQSCSYNFECRADGAAPGGLVCSDAGRCERPAGVTCASNLECVRANNNQPAVCLRPEGVCQSLLSEDCKAVSPGVEALFDDDVLLFGTFLTALANGGLPPQEQAVRLAAEEIAANAGGVPGADGRKRPLAFLHCYSSTDALRAARHLVDRARVPAFVGPGLSDLTIDVSNKLTVPSGVLLISPSATSPAVGSLNDNGLVWRTCPSDELQSKALAALLPKVEARARAAAGDPPPKFLRLATVVANNAYGQAVSTALTADLRFNGVAFADPANMPYVVSRSYEPTPDKKDPSFVGIANDLVALKPHIVVVIGSQAVIPNVVAIDKLLTDPKPVYLVSDGFKVPNLLASLEAGSDLPERMVGTAFGPGDAAQAFVQRYRQKYNDGSETTLGTNNAYDAAYLLALAAAGLDDVTGPALNERLKRTVLPGAPADHVFNLRDPSRVDAFFNFMARGEPFDVVGASGSLDFNTDVGEAPATIATWCVRPTGDGFGLTDTGLLYDPVTGGLSGTNKCNALTGP